jgi:DmsE family decaheme c-type cytochrome
MKKILYVLLPLFVFFLLFYAQQSADGDSGYVGADTCKGCHSEYYDSYAKSIHSKKALSGSPANRNECESCHGPGSVHVEKKGGKDTGMFAFNKKADANDKSAKCLACHEESRHLAFWDNGRHKSAGVSCPDCHSIHGGREKNLKAEQPDLCFGCHKDIRMMSNRQSHHPIREGKMKCTDCHNPTAALDQKWSRRTVSTNFATPAMLKKEDPSGLSIRRLLKTA